MTLTCTNKAYHKAQSIILPFVGEVKLDDNGSFDCPSDKVDAVIKASSVPFVVGGKANPFIAVVDNTAKKKEKEAKPTKKQIKAAAKETAATVVGDREVLIDAINEANIDELKQIAELVPGATSPGGNFVQPITEDALRAFLLEKLNQATAEV